MGKRTLAIRHTLEKNLFHKFCLTGLVIKHLFPYCSLRTEKEPLWLRYIYWKNADTISHSKSWKGWKFFFILCVQNQRMTTDCEKKDIFTTRHLTPSYDSATCRDECKYVTRHQNLSEEKDIKNVAWLLQYKTTTLAECDATNADVLKLLSGCSFNLTDEYINNVLRPLPPRHLYEVGHTWTTLKTSPDKSFNKQQVIYSIRCILNQRI